METPTNTSSHDLEDIRALTRWSRRYVQSRSVPVLAGLAFFGALIGAQLWLWSTVGTAYRSGNVVVLGTCAAVLSLSYVVLVWLCVPRWGGRWLERLGWRYYNSEGHAEPRTAMPRDVLQRWGKVVGLVFATCIVVHVWLSFAGIVDNEAALPISALYTVPFLTFVFVTLRSYVMLLYPTLYATHAALLATGVQDPFARVIGSEWSILAPIVVYGIVAVAVSHVYNRIALRRMAHFGRMEHD